MITLKKGTRIRKVETAGEADAFKALGWREVKPPAPDAQAAPPAPPKQDAKKK
jgi:hypothetical protein